MIRALLSARSQSWRRSGASLLIVILLGLELVAIGTAREDWPFTSGAMFAYYVTPESQLFRIEFVLGHDGPDGREEPLQPREHLGLSETNLRRLFFSRYYGSTDPHFPQGHHHEDTPDAFRGRLEVFLRRVSAILERRGHAVDRLRVEVQRLDAKGASVLERRVVATHVVESGRTELGHAARGVTR